MAAAMVPDTVLDVVVGMAADPHDPLETWHSARYVKRYEKCISSSYSILE